MFGCQARRLGAPFFRAFPQAGTLWSFPSQRSRRFKRMEPWKSCAVARMVAGFAMQAITIVRSE
jgi:hypothetical protein